MCEPATIAMLAITTVGALSAIDSQEQAAASQVASNNRQGGALLAARAQNANQINLQGQQAVDAAGQKLNENNIAMRQAQASVIARGGPSGLSVDALLGDIARKGATYNESVNANLARTDMALQSQLENVNTQTTSGFNNLKTPAPVDYLGAGLKIAGAGVGAYKSSAPGTSSSNNPAFDRYTKGNLGSGD